MLLVIERATSRGNSRGGAVAVAGGTSRPFKWRLRCLRHQLKFVSPGAAHSINLKALPKFERAAFLALDSRKQSDYSVFSRSVFSSQLPPSHRPLPPLLSHPASPSVLCLFLSLNRMSSLNPLMTISFDDISPSHISPWPSHCCLSLFFITYA